MEKIKFYTKSSISSTPELKMVIDVSGNVGIGESNPTKALEVVGDISFNGNLYQNGAPFQGGTLVNETTDISLNNLNVHGDLSANDASFNNVDISNILNVSNQIIVGDEIGPVIAFSNSNQTKITSSDVAGSDYFGYSVAISDSYVIVGSKGDDDNGSASGSAYIFDLTTGNQLHKLTANDAAASDEFGRSVSISDNYAIVGAPFNDDNGSESGSAYIFDVSSGQQLHKLTVSDGAANDIFGLPVAISHSYAIVGSKADDDNGTNSGSAYIFDVSSGQQLHKLTASDAADTDQFGFSVAISGNYAVIGASNNDDNGSNSGSAYIFNVISGNELNKITASDAAAYDNFGYSVAISGNYAVIGSPNDNSLRGAAYIFTGTSLFNALNVNGSCLFSGTVTSNGTLLTSDDRVKHNEQCVTNALSTISKLTPKHYFKTKNKLYDSSHNFILDVSGTGNPLDVNHQSLILNKDYTIETGIIAQEIQTIPELKFAVHETTPLGVDYNSIHCTHIAATKELYELVQTQQQEINNLKQENQTFTQRLQIIEQHLGI